MILEPIGSVSDALYNAANCSVQMVYELVPYDTSRDVGDTTSDEAYDAACDSAADLAADMAFDYE